MMYEWTEPYEDEYIKERVEEIRAAQQDASDHGKILLSSYEQFWLPVLNDLPDVEMMGRGSYKPPYGTIEPAEGIPFHGALWLSPLPGVELPPPLRNIRDWIPASAIVDINARMVKVQVDEIEITFTSINVSLNAHQLLEKINHELVRANGLPNCTKYLFSKTTTVRVYRSDRCILLWRNSMEGKLKCKKCGRVLKSAISIARGMGPICAGAGSPSKKSFNSRVTRNTSIAHADVTPSHLQTMLFSGDLPTKRMSKRELHRRRRDERRRLFENRLPFQCGMVLPKRRPLAYTPLEDGSWQENPGGRIISHQRLQAYLRRYQFI